MFEILQSLSILLYTMRQNLGGARKQGSTHNEGINADLWLILPRTEHEERDIRKCSSALYLKGKFEFTMVMLCQDNSQRSYNPQIKKAEKMILPSSSQRYSRA